MTCDKIVRRTNDERTQTVKVSKDILVDAAFDAGLEPNAVRIDYSGRGMYGDRCIGIVGDLEECRRFERQLQTKLYVDEHQGEDDIENTIVNFVDWCDHQFPSSSQDSMGLSMILYWPRLEFDRDPEEWDEFDE